MLKGRLDILQVDNDRGIVEGEIVLEESYGLNTLVIEAFGLHIYVTPFDITEISAEDNKLIIGFSVMTSMATINRLIEQIALRN